MAVIGTGRMGMLRIQGIMSNKNAKLKAIVDESSDRCELLSNQFNVKSTTNLEEALNDDTIDAIWVSTPTLSHLPIIEAATRCKKHVAVEKPVADSLQEIEQAYDSAEKNQVELFCSFQRRFDPSYKSLKDAVDGGDIGAVQSIISVFRDHPMPSIEFLKTGGDPFHDLAVHDIDYVCDVIGEYPVKVIAHGTSIDPTLKEINVMDKASVWLEFPSGIICCMDISRGSPYGYDQRVEIFGTRGMVQVQNQPSTSLVSSTKQGINHGVYLPSFPERFHQAYISELDHFIDIVLNRSKPVVTRENAVMATIVAEASKISAQNGCPVKLVRKENHVELVKC